MDNNWIEKNINISNIKDYNKIFLNVYLDNFNFSYKNKSLLEQNYDKILETINKEDYNKDYEKLYSLELLELQKNISSFLLNFSNNKCLNYIILLNSLNKMHDISTILGNRLKLPNIKIKNKKNYIFKTKYKFCQYKCNCQYNYGETKNKCIGKHYVHNILKADLLQFINYIKTFDNNIIQNNKEIIKTIKTLNFVIVRMWEELTSLCIYQDKDKWESFHVIN